jgi:xylose dehydrogenase (NAD/NADP)
MNVDAHLADFTRRDWQTIDDGTVRIAIVGLGGFATDRALPAIQETDFCTATVLVSGSPEKAEEIAAEFDVGEVIDYDDFDDGTATESYDAVYVATPPAYHRPYTETAARLGKHVLCEKPLAADTDDATRMIEVCTEHDVTLMTAYRLRTEPSVRRLREMVRDGLLGDVVQINGGFALHVLDHVGADSWRLDPAVAGGGALIDLGIYPINLSRFLLGSDPTAVWGDTTSGSDPFVAVEEHATVQLSFPSGVTATCSASFDAYPDSRLHVLGTEGQVLIREPFGGTVTQELVVERGETCTEYTGPLVDEVTEEFDYFANCVLTEAECEMAGEDGLVDLEIIEAAYEAAATSKRVSL